MNQKNTGKLNILDRICITKFKKYSNARFSKSGCVFVFALTQIIQISLIKCEFRALVKMLYIRLSLSRIEMPILANCYSKFVKPIGYSLYGPCVCVCVHGYEWLCVLNFVRHWVWYTALVWLDKRHRKCIQP